MEVIDSLVSWISEQVKSAGSRGAVFGLSGGLDSAVVGGLCARALGDGALGLILPCHSSPEDMDDARLVCDAFGLKTITIELSGVYDEFLKALPEACVATMSNLKPRLRMAALYYVANEKGCLVAGTGNKSEYMVGYFTKYGDGGVDIMPLACIYKTDLFEIARELGVPERIVEKPPSAGLWTGQTDEKDLGLSYAELDRALKLIEQGGEEELEPSVLEKVRGMVRRSEHKRNLPPRCGA